MKNSPAATKQKHRDPKQEELIKKISNEHTLKISKYYEDKYEKSSKESIFIIPKIIASINKIAEITPSLNSAIIQNDFFRH